MAAAGSWQSQQPGASRLAAPAGSHLHVALCQHTRCGLFSADKLTPCPLVYQPCCSAVHVCWQKVSARHPAAAHMQPWFADMRLPTCACPQPS